MQHREALAARRAHLAALLGKLTDDERRDPGQGAAARWSGWPTRNSGQDERSAQPVEHRGGGPGLLHAAQRLAGERLVVLGEGAVAGLPQAFAAQASATARPSPRRANAQENSQVITGHTGPRQYSRGRKSLDTGDVDGISAYFRSGCPQNRGPSSSRSSVRSWSCGSPPHSSGANCATVSVAIHLPARTS